MVYQVESNNMFLTPQIHVRKCTHLYYFNFIYFLFYFKFFSYMYRWTDR